MMFISRLRSYLAVAVIAVLVFLPALSRAGTTCDDIHDRLMKLTNRSRGLTLSILRQVKEFNRDFRDESGEPLPGKKPQALERLGKIKRLADGFEANANELDKLFEKYDSECGTEAGDIGQFKADAKKYRGYVDKHYGRAVKDFGQPVTSSVQYATAPADGQLRFKGEARFGLGGSQYKRPALDYKASGSDLELGIKGTFVPRIERLAFDFNLNHRTTVEQREIGLTKFGAAAIYLLSPSSQIKSGFDYDHYSDKDNKPDNYGQLGFFADFAHRSSRLNVKAGVRLTDRGYGDDEDKSFSTKKLYSSLEMNSPTGRFLFAFHYRKKSANTYHYLDHNDFNPYFRWTSNSGGTELEINLQRLTHPEDPEVDPRLLPLLGQPAAPEDNSRLKIHLYRLSRSSSGSSRSGPELAMYKYPDNDEKNYYDIGYTIQKRSRGKKITSNAYDAVYRLYTGDELHDFFQLRISKNTLPVGIGRYSKWNLAARVYTEGSDKDDLQYSANFHPPHTLDFYYSLGWSRTGGGPIQTFTFGPLLGARFYIDTEREDALDNDVNYIFANPANTAKGGLASRLEFSFPPALRGDISAEYSMTFFYNADPTRRNSIMSFRSRIYYTITSQFLIEGSGEFHTNRVDIDSSSDLDRTRFNAVLRYLFDVQR